MNVAGFVRIPILVALGILANSATAEPFHFAHDIAPILARNDCSAAECHGGAAGKGGFKLSLFSSNPKADYAAITREFGARRIDLVDPDRSLMLRKSTKDLKHGGGRIFDTEDASLAALREWIANGAPWSTGQTRELTGLNLEIVDNRAVATASFGETQRDVTALTIFESTSPGVAVVDEEGEIVRRGPGETWILARYGNLNARTPILTPFDEIEHSRQTDHPLDQIWLARLAELGLKPAPRADDSTILRRLYLDLAGRPPSPLDLTRTDALDRLLKSDDFAGTWARHVASWFEVPIPERDPRNSAETHNNLRSFFLTSMQNGDSAADIARRVLLEPTPSRAWKRFSDPRDRAEFVGRSMLGIRIGCARCHNHPLDRWKQDEHLRFSAFFSDDRPNPDGGMMAGQFFEPESGKLVEPALLPFVDAPPPAASRAEQVAWLVLDSGHDQFARNITNRVFAQLIGQPLVDAEDDHRLSNPPIHAQLLDRLARELIDHDYDLRALVRFIATSDLYALSSQSDEPSATKYLATREARRLNADEFRRAVSFVTGVELNQQLPPESPLAEQLYVLNSGLIRTSLTTPGNQIDALFDFGVDPERQLEELFALILSREPTAAERDVFLPEFQNADDIRERARDLAFALLASREFGSVR
ncbi:MAG: DUF1549 domain-containing protein [Verrucomicrobiota bacterium]